MCGVGGGGGGVKPKLHCVSMVSHISGLCYVLNSQQVCKSSYCNSIDSVAFGMHGC